MLVWSLWSLLTNWDGEAPNLLNFLKLCSHICSEDSLREMTIFLFVGFFKENYFKVV